MTELQRSMLLRYLHERQDMSVGERFGVEWQLWVNGATRKEYADMQGMHRSLSSHLAATAAVMVTEPRVPWLRVGVAGLTGAVAVASSLLWVKDVKIPIRPAPATSVALSGLHCSYCAASREQCAHCVAVAQSTAPESAATQSPKTHCSSR